MAGHPQSAATRAKISKALKGKRHPHRGVSPSAAARAKLSAALKGKPHPHKGVKGPHKRKSATRR
jgi:hypothetical protein